MSDADLATTLRMVERKRDDGLLETLRNAPEDNEAWTGEDEAAVAASRADFAAGRTASHDEMVRKYG